MFPIVFWKFLWGDKALMDGDKVAIEGIPQSSPPLGKNRNWLIGGLKVLKIKNEFIVDCRYKRLTIS